MEGQGWCSGRSSAQAGGAGAAATQTGPRHHPGCVPGPFPPPPTRAPAFIRTALPSGQGWGMEVGGTRAESESQDII